MMNQQVQTKVAQFTAIRFELQSKEYPSSKSRFVFLDKNGQEISYISVPSFVSPGDSVTLIFPSNPTQSTPADAGAQAIDVLRLALSDVGITDGHERASILGHFCNRWNAAVATGSKD